VKLPALKGGACGALAGQSMIIGSFHNQAHRRDAPAYRQAGVPPC
jgi:hypothetical protein